MVRRTRRTSRYSQHFSQTGHTTIPVDRKLKAKRVGWRKSKSGRWYKETRKNRSDKNRRLRL
jgi:predicted DNA-binding transcriptional regulator AlpA